MDFRYTKLISEYTVYQFDNYFDDDTLIKLIEDAQKYPYSSLNGKRTDKNKRIWMHKYYEFKSVCYHFDSIETKTLFSSITGIDYTRCRTRIELCNDEKGSWLETHGDDPAKLFTFQVYLTNIAESTKFSEKSTAALTNSGWFFNNTGTEMHGLSPLSHRRSSIIVNYVDSKWRNQDVLVDG